MPHSSNELLEQALSEADYAKKKKHITSLIVCGNPASYIDAPKLYFNEGIRKVFDTYINDFHLKDELYSKYTLQSSVSASQFYEFFIYFKKQTSGIYNYYKL